MTAAGGRIEREIIERVIIERVIDGRVVQLSNPDKLIWPELGITKRALLAYFEAIAPVLLPHLRGRPLTLARFPDGIDGPGFYQTRCHRSPEWLETAPLPTGTGKDVRCCVANDLASLLWIANQGTVELHPFLGRLPRVDVPSELMFDLDPGEDAGPLAAAEIALRVRSLLKEHGLEGWVKTSGRRGVHVHVPLVEGATFTESRAFARALARRLAQERPDAVTDVITKASRGERVFIDYSQNSVGKSTIAPWSLRALRVPLVAAPLRWEELEQAVGERSARVLAVTPEEALERARRGDFTSEVRRQSLPSRSRSSTPLSLRWE